MTHSYCKLEPIRLSSKLATTSVGRPFLLPDDSAPCSSPLPGEGAATSWAGALSLSAIVGFGFVFGCLRVFDCGTFGRAFRLRRVWERVRVRAAKGLLLGLVAAVGVDGVDELYVDDEDAELCGGIGSAPGIFESE